MFKILNTMLKAYQSPKYDTSFQFVPEEVLGVSAAAAWTATFLVERWILAPWSARLQIFFGPWTEAAATAGTAGAGLAPAITRLLLPANSPAAALPFERVRDPAVDLAVATFLIDILFPSLSSPLRPAVCSPRVPLGVPVFFFTLKSEK